MAAKLVRIGFRVAILAAVCVLGFYIGRPVYWKLTATLQDIREKDYTHEAVKEGFSNLMRDAQNSVGWGQPGATSGTDVGQVLAVQDTEKKKGNAKQKKTPKDSTKDAADTKTGDLGSTARRLTRRLLES